MTDTRTKDQTIEDMAKAIEDETSFDSIYCLKLAKSAYEAAGVEEKDAENENLRKALKVVAVFFRKRYGNSGNAACEKALLDFEQALDN